MGGFASMSRRDLHPRGRKRKTIRHLTQRGARVRSMEKKKEKKGNEKKKEKSTGNWRPDHFGRNPKSMGMRGMLSRGVPPCGGCQGE